MFGLLFRLLKLERSLIKYMLNTGNRVCLFFSFFQVCVCLFNVLSAIQSPINPPSFSSPCLPSLPTFFTSADLLLKKKSGFPFADGCFIVQQKMPHHSSQREACQLCCCNLFLSHTLTHTHADFAHATLTLLPAPLVQAKGVTE